MAGYEYFLDNKWEAARDRLTELEKVCDPWTIRNLKEIGVGRGWYCLEVAGGGGSIAAWLGSQVGSHGHVLATDLEPHFLEALKGPNISVERHNILTDDLPQSAFDLVHTRALLVFLPEPKQVIAKLAGALKPGGWLLVEEPDYVSAIPDPTMTESAIEISRKGWDALLGHLQSRGYDKELGRRLYYDLVSARMVDVRAAGIVGMMLGGTPSARLWRSTLEQIQNEIIASGRLTPEDFHRYRELLEDPEYRWLSPTLMSVWGRRALPSMSPAAVLS
jgi:SAM-dependent methyltransferase